MSETGTHRSTSLAGNWNARGITPEINAVSTIIFAVSVALIIIWYRIRMRGVSTEAQQLLERP